MKKTAFDIVANQDLSGKTFLITGGYAGLGAISTEALLKAGARVVIAGRSAKTQADYEESRKGNAELKFSDEQLDASHTLDLGDLASVRDFALYIRENYQQIDCLLNNAGVMNTPPGKTKDGFEIQMGINVIGHFLLSKMLVEITKRQIWLSSKGHIRYGAPRIDLAAITEVDDNNYISRHRYQQAKLGDILLAKQFAKAYPHLKTAAVHPGGVKTNLGRYMTTMQKVKFVLKMPHVLWSMVEPEVGASTQVMVSILPEDELVNGAYYVDCKVAKEAESAKNMEDAQKLFDYCEKVTKAFQV